jgi:hypothetical protein
MGLGQSVGIHVGTAASAVRRAKLDSVSRQSGLRENTEPLAEPWKSGAFNAA